MKIIDKWTRSFKIICLILTVMVTYFLNIGDHLHIRSGLGMVSQSMTVVSN